MVAGSSANNGRMNQKIQNHMQIDKPNNMVVILKAYYGNADYDSSKM